MPPPYRPARPLQNTSLSGPINPNARLSSGEPLQAAADRQRPAVQASLSRRLQGGGSYYGDRTGTVPTPVQTTGQRVQAGSPVSNNALHAHVTGMQNRPLQPGTPYQVGQAFHYFNQPGVTEHGTPLHAMAQNPATYRPGSPLHESAVASQRFQGALADHLASPPPPMAPHVGPAGSLVNGVKMGAGRFAPGYQPPAVGAGGLVAAPKLTPQPGAAAASPLANAVRGGTAEPSLAPGVYRIPLASLLGKPAAPQPAAAPPTYTPDTPRQPTPEQLALPPDPHARGVALNPNARSRIPSWAGGGMNMAGVKGAVGRPVAPASSPLADAVKGGMASAPAVDPVAAQLAARHSAAGDSLMAGGDVKGAQAAYLRANAYKTMSLRDAGQMISEMDDREGKAAALAEQNRQAGERNVADIATANAQKMLAEEQARRSRMALDPIDQQHAEMVQNSGQEVADRWKAEALAARAAGRTPPVAPGSNPNMTMITSGLDRVVKDSEGKPISDPLALARNLGVSRPNLDPASPEGRALGTSLHNSPELLQKLKELDQSTAYESDPSKSWALPNMAELARARQTAHKNYGWAGRRVSAGLNGIMGYWRHSPEELLREQKSSSALLHRLLGR